MESDAAAEIRFDPDQIDRLATACAELLRPPEQWSGFAGYPGGLALAVIDAIWSTGTRYPITRGVVGRYRAIRMREGADASQDSLTDLLGAYTRLGGVDGFIRKVGTRNRVSTQPGALLKGEAVQQAATILRDLGIDTAQQFLEADSAELGGRAQAAWKRVPGQASGISWRYLRMLLGLADVKPDRMIIRFLAAALGIAESTITPNAAAHGVTTVAARLHVDPRALDHEIWEYQSGYRGRHDPDSTVDHLRTAARSFLGAAMSTLGELHVVPSVYRPFLRVGYDYEGTAVMGLPEFADLEAAIERNYPGRFQGSDISRLHSKSEFASSYIFPLLEAALARCAIHYEEFDADNELATRTVGDLINLLDGNLEQLRCCREVSHLTTSSGGPITVNGITVHPDTEPGYMERQLQEIIPRALDEELPHVFNPPMSLLSVEGTSAPGDAYESLEELSQRIDRFLLLARLLYAGTVQSSWQVAGPAAIVSPVKPQHRAFGEEYHLALAQRVIKLSPEDARSFAALDGYLDAATVKREGMATTSFDIAVSRFTRAHEAQNPFEAIVDLATAFEAILISDDSDTEAITARLRNRAAIVLATDTDPGAAIYRDVNKLYGLRSSLVHGGALKEKDLRKAITTISTIPESTPFGLAGALAVDRMRDLVRRSFLARLALAAGPDALWPFGVQKQVDQALADDGERERWRKHWRQALTDLGVPEAANPAGTANGPFAMN